MKTKKDLEKLTDKEIIYIPFWSDQNTWFKIDDKEELRKKYELPLDAYIIGSFQRDTEGSDLKSPKLIKGPDRLIKIIKSSGKIFLEVGKGQENRVIKIATKHGLSIKEYKKDLSGVTRVLIFIIK